MFTYFHNHKLRYEKGQMLPIFIVLLVVVLIMAMMTINLSKVAWIKTESANSADAGGLAAAAVMANTFNALAAQNSALETQYQEFYASVAAQFAIATYHLTSALVKAYAASSAAASASASACPNPCGAAGQAASAAAQAASSAGSLGSFNNTVIAIMISVTAFYIAQQHHYEATREMVEEGRESAIEMGHRFAFTNSGTFGRLPGRIEPDSSWTRSRRDFSNFIDNQIGHDSIYAFDWIDGQGRNHFVRTQVEIDDVDTYDVQVAKNSFPVELASLLAMLYSGYSAKGNMVAAAAAYAGAALLLTTACACQACCNPLSSGCCACWMAACTAAVGLLGTGMGSNNTAIIIIALIYPSIATALLGLLPGPIVTDDGGETALSIICWIDDIIHNREVRVDTWQSHGGLNLGLRQFTYPEIHSFSRLSFRGLGLIYPPELRHDASIIETDQIGI